MSQEKILVVDDEPGNLQLIRMILGKDYSLIFATDGYKALEATSKHRPDLILMDVMMPNMDGYGTCRELKKNPNLSSIPVLFVTAMGETENEEQGFDSGGVDYIVKPIKPQLLKHRIRTHLSLVKTEELKKTQRLIIEILGRAAEFKDNETGKHVIRMSYYSYILAQKLKEPDDWCKLILQAAPMHDIGKIGIPDNILLENGPLNDEEWDIMRKHPIFGQEIIGFHNSNLLNLAREIAVSHHEKWNGKGYPNGLKGENIPLSGRIIAIADVFDALVTVRPYKKAWKVEDAFDLIESESGQHFDPRLANAFLECKEDILKIKAEWPEE